MCDNPQTNELKNYCNCQKAVESLSGLIDTYNAQMKTYTQDSESYKRFLNRYSEWLNKTGEFAKYATYGISEDVRVWDVPWGWVGGPSGDSLCASCATRQAHDNGWSQDSTGIERGTGYSGIWVHCNQKAGDPLVGASWYVEDKNSEALGWTSSQQTINFRCVKSPERINAETAEYNAAMPTTDPVTGRNWSYGAGPTLPVPPNGNNIQCCSQIFSNIDATNVSFKNVAQQCQQQINAQIEAATTSTKKPVDIADLLKFSDTGTDTSGTGVWIYIVVVVAVVLLLSSSSSSLILATV